MAEEGVGAAADTVVADPHTAVVVVEDMAAVATHHEAAATVADTAREEDPVIARTRIWTQNIMKELRLRSNCLMT